MPNPCFQVFRDRTGKYRFRLCAANGQTILQSQGYASKRSAENGIKAVKKNARYRDRYDLRKSSGDKAYFVLQSANGEAVGRSQMYSSASSRSRGMKSVMGSAGKARIQYE